MSKSLEFFFDVGSPTTYLAWTQLPKIAAEAGATIIWRPMLLGGVFKATGNQSPVNIPAKARYMLQDLARYARRYGVPMTFNPHFPINTLTLMRGAAGYLDTPQFATFHDGANVMYIIDAIVKSHQQQRWVRVEQ